MCRSENTLFDPIVNDVDLRGALCITTSQCTGVLEKELLDGHCVVAVGLIIRFACNMINTQYAELHTHNTHVNCNISGIRRP